MMQNKSVKEFYLRKKIESSSRVNCGSERNKMYKDRHYHRHHPPAPSTTQTPPKITTLSNIATNAVGLLR